MRGSNTVAALSIGLACAGCATTAGAPLSMALGPATTQIEGWLSARGELTLFPARSREDGYDPYTSNDSERCVSLVNATGRDHAVFQALNGRRVVAEGRAVTYDSLADGKDAADRLMGRKYHGGEIVQNFCVRRYVFLASRVDAAK